MSQITGWPKANKKVWNKWKRINPYVKELDSSFDVDYNRIWRNGTLIFFATTDTHGKPSAVMSNIRAEKAGKMMDRKTKSDIERSMKNWMKEHGHAFQDTKYNYSVTSFMTDSKVENNKSLREKLAPKDQANLSTNWRNKGFYAHGVEVNLMSPSSSGLLAWSALAVDQNEIPTVENSFIRIGDNEGGEIGVLEIVDKIKKFQNRPIKSAEGYESRFVLEAYIPGVIEGPEDL